MASDTMYLGMGWRVDFTGKAAKQFKKLPEDIQLALRALIAEIEAGGPYRANWPHYSPLKHQDGKYH